MSEEMTREQAIRDLRNTSAWKRIVSDTWSEKSNSISDGTKDAIWRLNDIKRAYQLDKSDEWAVDMAIAALSVEPCKDTISRGVFEQVMWERDVAIEQLKELGYGLGEKPKTGHWISHYDEDAKEGWYECDRCHTERAFNTDYCPDCGAKMVEPQERSK